MRLILSKYIILNSKQLKSIPIVFKSIYIYWKVKKKAFWSNSERKNVSFGGCRPPQKYNAKLQKFRANLENIAIKIHGNIFGPKDHESSTFSGKSILILRQVK